jgi:hypothetical protein
MWGYPSHVASLANTVQERYPQPAVPATEDSESVELDVLVAQTNQSNHTYDGVDCGGERVITEVRMNPTLKHVAQQSFEYIVT